MHTINKNTNLDYSVELLVEIFHLQVLRRGHVGRCSACRLLMQVLQLSNLGFQIGWLLLLHHLHAAALWGVCRTHRSCGHRAFFFCRAQTLMNSCRGDQRPVGVT